MCFVWRTLTLRDMEKFTSALSQYVDPNQLQKSVPEYLWFVIAVLGIGAIIYVLHRLVNYLMEAVSELRESNAENSKAIAVLQEMLHGVKDMVADHEHDIRSLQSGKRNRGQP